MSTVRIVSATKDREFDLEEVLVARSGGSLPERVTENQVKELAVWYADVPATEARPLKAKLLSNGDWMVQEIESFGEEGWCICGHREGNHTLAGCNVRGCSCKLYMEENDELELA